MNAFELADYLDNNVEAMLISEQSHIDNATNMLRQQADRIAELEKEVEEYEELEQNYMKAIQRLQSRTPQTKSLSDEEILAISGEIVGDYEIAFARAIEAKVRGEK